MSTARMPSLRVQAYENFREQIVRAQIRPGQFISQRELMQLLGMPLGAVRELIPRLKAGGASGIVEAVVACLSLSEGLLPGSVNCSHPDDFGAPFARLLQRVAEPRALQVAMSNSFGFGGNNCSLVFARSWA